MVRKSRPMDPKPMKLCCPRGFGLRNASSLRRRTSDKSTPRGENVIHAGDFDSFNAVADEDVDLGVEEWEPSDFGDRDLLGLVVEIGALVEVADGRVGFF